MKKLIIVSILIVTASCNKTYYCHCENEIMQDLSDDKNKKQAKSECDSYETAETGDCYVTLDPLD